MSVFSLLTQKFLHRYRQSAGFVQGLVVCSVVIMLALLFSLYLSLEELTELEQQRTQRVQIARELYTSSRELTYMAQLFVTTGDPAAEQNYQHQLQIRRGLLPRPANQTLAPGQNRPMSELFAHVTEPASLELLHKSLQASDALAEKEQEAINAFKGMFRDSRGKYSVRGKPDPQMAFDMLHGVAYQQGVTEIMRPLDKFFARIDLHTEQAVNETKSLALIKMLLICLGMVLFFVSLLGVSYYILARKEGGKSRALTYYIYIVGIMLASISLPAWLTYSDARQDIIAGMEKRQNLLCREIFRELQLRLMRSTEIASLVASRPVVVNFMRSYDSTGTDSAKLRQTMEVVQAINRNHSGSESIFLINPHGLIALSSEGHRASEYATLLDPQVLTDIKNGNTVICTLDRGHGPQPVVAVPIRDDKSEYGKILGAAVILMHLNGDGKLWDGRLAVDEKMIIFMLDATAKVVVSSNPDWMPGMDASRETAGKIAMSSQEGLHSYQDSQNDTRIGVYMRLPELGWTLAVSSAQDLVLSSVRRMLTRSLALSSAVTLLAIVLVTLLFIRLLQNMRRSEDRLEMVIQGAGIGIWDLDFVARRFSFNEFWGQLSGLPAQRGEESLEWPFSMCYPSDLAGLTEMLDSLKVEKVDNDSQGGACECRTFNGEGWSWRRITARVTERDQDGAVIRISGTTTDIDARKVAEMNGNEYRDHLEEMVSLRTHELEEARNQAIAATKVKSAFLSTVSHEIRTPMNAIIGFIHLFERDNLQEKQLAYLDKMHLAANTLLSIINDVLDISKIEAQKMEMESLPFLLPPVIDGAKSIMGFAAREKDLELKVEYSPDVPSAVQGDPTRLQQILLNLLSNAVKFTQHGRITLKVQVLNDADDEARNSPSAPSDDVGTIRRLLFRVTDTGIGMSQAQMDRLFQPFTQADNTVARKFGGTGLGLAICKQLAELMGGSICVSSQIGQGTTFSVELPLCVVDPVAVQPTVRASTKGSIRPVRHSGPVRALVVDDNDINLEIAQAMLEAEGLDVDLAENGLDALEKLTLGGYDIVFMDMQMPVMDGLEATRRIRALAMETGTEALRTLPIIAMTANAMVEDKKLCFEAGMNDHLSKPIEPERLRELLVYWAGLPVNDA